MRTEPKYDKNGDGYMGLLGAIFERAHADARGDGLGGVARTKRRSVQEEAAEFLEWANEIGLDANADRGHGRGIFRGRRL